MKQENLSKWLKAVLIGLALAGLVVFFYLIPVIGQDIVKDYPEFKGWYLPWLCFLLISGIPCFAVVFFGWRIAGNIGRDRSFSMDNALFLKRIAQLAAADSAWFFIGNLVLFILGMNHPGVALGSLVVVFAGVCISIASAVLSHLVEKAAGLQEESDLTI